MPGNGKVFISHAHEDNDRCAPLLAALDAWGVDYWFDTQRMDAGHDLLASVQRAIADRDIFIRVGTTAALNSYWMNQELSAFMGLQAIDHREGHGDNRLLIPFKLEPGYEFQPMELGRIYIDASDRQQRQWIEELRRALGLTTRSVAGSPPVDRSGAHPARPAPPYHSTPAAPAALPNQAELADLMQPLPQQLPHAATESTPAEPPIAPSPTSAPSASSPAHHTPEVTASRSIVVDRDGQGDHRTIRDALNAASPNDRILIRRGVYNEALSIDKPIELVGDGNRHEVVIEHNVLAKVVLVSAKGVRLKNLQLRGLGASAVDVVSVTSGDVILEHCDMSSGQSGYSGIYVVAGKAVVQECRIHDCGRNGVVLEGPGAEAILEDNEITHCAMAAIHIKPGAQVTIRRNLITDNQGVAIQLTIPFIKDVPRARGTIEDNTLRPNKKGAWTIESGAAADIKRARNLE